MFYKGYKLLTFEPHLFLELLSIFNTQSSSNSNTYLFSCKFALSNLPKQKSMKGLLGLLSLGFFCAKVVYLSNESTLIKAKLDGDKLGLICQ